MCCVHVFVRKCACVQELANDCFLVCSLQYQTQPETLQLLPRREQIASYFKTMRLQEKANDSLQTLADLHQWGQARTLQGLLQKQVNDKVTLDDINVVRQRGLSNLLAKVCFTIGCMCMCTESRVM